MSYCYDKMSNCYDKMSNNNKTDNKTDNSIDNILQQLQPILVSKKYCARARDKMSYFFHIFENRVFFGLFFE